MNISSPRVYGIATFNDEILLVRSSNPQLQPPVWWLPGGGIEFGESPEEALTREFHEETGLTISSPHLLCVTSDLRRRPNGDHVHTVRIHYVIEHFSGTLAPEQQGTTDFAAWISRADLASRNVAPYVHEALAYFDGK